MLLYMVSVKRVTRLNEFLCTAYETSSLWKAVRLRWPLATFFLVFASRFRLSFRLSQRAWPRVQRCVMNSSKCVAHHVDAYRNAWPLSVSLAPAQNAFRRQLWPDAGARGLPARIPRPEIRGLSTLASLAPSPSTRPDKSARQSEIVICGWKNDCVMALRSTANNPADQSAICMVSALRIVIWSLFHVEKTYVISSQIYMI